MKVQELRQLLSKADRAMLEKAFVESYKQLTKQKKEDIDPVIRDILDGKDVSASAKKNKAANFDELKCQITDFIENAYEQNYFAPNRVIPKSQRPKWRFLVKNYIKELQNISVDDANYQESVKLMTDLYRLICYACNYYLFSTDDPFRSIGWNQSDFFQLVVKKTFGDGYTREKISDLLLYAVSGGLSGESLHIFQEMVLLSQLNTSDVKYLAIEEAKKLVENRAGKLSAARKYDNKRFELEETINELCNMILIITIDLAEPEEGIVYYFNNCRETSKEIVLYCALEVADWMDGDNELWISIYRYGLKKKIKPREALVEEYKKRLAEMEGQSI